MRIQFKLLQDKADSTGTMPVVLFAYYDSKRFVFYTTERCTVKQFDSEKMRFRKSMPGYFEANSYLEFLEESTKRAYREYLTKGIIPSPIMLKDALLPEKAIVVQSFFSLYDDFMINLQKKGCKIGTIKHYKTVKNRLLEFNKIVQLSVTNFTKDVHSKWIDFLMAKQDYHPNYIGTLNKDLKAFFNWCVEYKGVELSKSHAKLKRILIDSEKVFLTEDELQKLITINLCGIPSGGKLEKVRDSFLFACMTGLRHSDLHKLSIEQIIERDNQKIISIIPIKSQSKGLSKINRVEIPLNQIALNLIQKYEGAKKSLPVFSNQKMNEYLKELCRLAEITTLIETTIYQKNIPKTTFVPKYEKISCHTARHTFATLALQRGLPIELLQKFLGHADLKTTMIYAKIVDEYKNKKLLEVWEF